MADPRNLEEALRAGALRAAAHLLAAGREVAAGVGAFLDEVIRVRREPPDESGGSGTGPTRIEVE